MESSPNRTGRQSIVEMLMLSSPVIEDHYQAATRLPKNEDYKQQTSRARRLSLFKLSRQNTQSMKAADKQYYDIDGKVKRSAKNRSSLQISKGELPIGLRNSRRFSIALSHRRHLQEFSNERPRASSHSFDPPDIDVPPILEPPTASAATVVPAAKSVEDVEAQKTFEDNEVFESNGRGQIWGTFDFVKPTVVPSVDPLLAEVTSHTSVESFKDDHQRRKSFQDMCFTFILCSGAIIILFSVCISLGLFILKFIGHFANSENQKTFDFNL